MLPRLVRRALEPAFLLWRHRGTLRSFVRRDLKGRYASSMFGLSWAVLQPLALLGLYTFLFGSILEVRLGAEAGTSAFALYLFCGMLPWLAFSDGISRCCNVLIDHSSLIKKVVFPSELLPAYVVCSALALEVAALLAFLGVCCALGRPPGWTALALFPLMGLQVLFTLGLGLALAALNVFLRDVGQVLGLVLTTWMFLTPIFYPPDRVPQKLAPLLAANPMHHLVQAYRSALLDGQLPEGGGLGFFALVAFASLALGGWFFRRSRRAFADVV
jgi:lipopolysaccharide transport system permease protein